MSEANEFERGRIHERVAEHDRRLDAINGSIDRAEAAINGLTVKVSTIGRSVAIYASLAAGICGVVGSVIGAILVYKLTGGHR